MLDFIYALIGLVILVLAGDALVRGAVNMSLRLGIPALIVSLTVVAIGTSAPELLVGVSAMLEGAPGIALGNVVGSNTANVLLVLGVPALISGLRASETDPRDSYIQMLIATALFVIAAIFSPITWISGIIMVSTLAFFMFHAVRVAQRHRAAERKRREVEPIEVEGVDPNMRWRKILLLLLLGIIGLPLGAEILVMSATNIATDYGISETVIGLTLVAVGTSLPELATTISAAIRRQADVAIGNVIGSNMANILGIIGISALIGPIPVPTEVLARDILIMVAASLLLIPFVFLRMDIGRAWGIAFLTGYIIYMVSLF